MSGICSKHNGHDKNCSLCLARPLTEEEKVYYKGMDDYRAMALRNCWTSVENCVLNVYTALEDAARAGSSSEIEKALKEIDKLRELKRGMWKRGLKV